MKYSIFIEKSAQKSLGKISQPFQGRIIESIRLLANDPRPDGVKKLAAREAWRIRVGVYRVIYEIHDEKLKITGEDGGIGHEQRQQQTANPEQYGGIPDFYSAKRWAEHRGALRG